MGEIVVEGRPVALACEVRRELQFEALGRRTETRAVVLHWTGGEGGGAQVFRVLKERGLSVNFTIDRAGVVWQYADAAARCAHVGPGNAWTCGIEMTNAANGLVRDVPAYTERVHGKAFSCSGFTPAQLASAKELVGTLCRAFGLPYVSPSVSTFLESKVLKEYRGVLGHFHFTRRKVDPGTRVFRELGLVGKEG